MAFNGLKMDTFHLFAHPNSPGSFLENPFLSYFWSQNNPFSRHLGILRWSKRATSSKRAKNTCFGIVRGLSSFLKKVIFLHQLDLTIHFGAHLFVPLLAACHRYECLGVRSGSFGWPETTKSAVD